MGWTFSRNWRTRKELVDYLRSKERWGTGYELLAATTRGNHHWYLMKHPSGVVFIGLDLLQGGRREHGWGYKDMDESCGPTALDCPLSYLAKASPPSNQFAYEWRDAVVAWHKRQAAKPQPLPGLRILIGPTAFVLSSPAGKSRGWFATREWDGQYFRIGAAMLSRALLRLARELEEKNEVAQTEGEVA